MRRRSGAPLSIGAITGVPGLRRTVALRFTLRRARNTHLFSHPEMKIAALT
jgi:hypothetical protein